MTIDPVTYHLIQLQARRAKLVSERDNLNNVIAELDESIRLITLLSSGDQQPPQNYPPEPRNIVTESFRLLRERLGHDPDPNTRIKFRLG